MFPDSVYLGNVLEKRTIHNEEMADFGIDDGGLYFVQIVTDKKAVTKKVVISK